MKALTDFKATLTGPTPDASWAAPLRSLWYDAKGDWHRAHALVDQLQDADAAWVHAYLHRKEGDSWNAGYWYRKAGKPHATATLDEEWEQLVINFLGR
ncbi:hypothetical protein MUY27_08595 [Mucilaginibacter sp. RS28]|uniref:Uncharacterized protein n=1 Tax=Mucilaginibacter straminoryzae TaxID=2932774 RepID=A0A9X1X349_9SPHI|nr:hypothetical protein [Mucilaginibacter straminoryzae]MCJ8209766.1 hypothetical protein [Mucilaginibacter straminoryzae]